MNVNETMLLLRLVLINYDCAHGDSVTTFPSKPVAIRVPFFLIFGFKMETPK